MVSQEVIKTGVVRKIGFKYQEVLRNKNTYTLLESNLDQLIV